MSFALYGLGACALLAANFVLYKLVTIERAAGRQPSLLFFNEPKLPGQLGRFVVFGILSAIGACALVVGWELR